MLKSLGSWVTGNQGAKVTFRKNVLRLFEERNISSNEKWWNQFWELPESAEDVFSLMTANDIKRTLSNSRENLESLIHKVSSELFFLITSPDFPSSELPINHALNCVRILTHIMPYIYESNDSHQWEEKFFWTPQLVRKEKSPIQSGSNTIIPEFEEQILPPLGERLMIAVIDMLYFSGFTLPSLISSSNTKINYIIWEAGVGSSVHFQSTKEHDQNRVEILRLLLVLLSKSMYISGPTILTKGNRWIQFLVKRTERKVILALLCSLLNTIIKFNPSGFGIPYNHMVYKNPKEILVTYCLQVLLVLLDYQPPTLPMLEPNFASSANDGDNNIRDNSNNNLAGISENINLNRRVPVEKASSNSFRFYLGKIHREQDFKQIIDGIHRILSNPIQTTGSLLPGSQKQFPFYQEVLMLLWDFFKINEKFKNWLLDTEKAVDVLVLIMYYSVDHKNDPGSQGLHRMCAYMLQILSVDQRFAEMINKQFDGQGTLPANVRIPTFNGSYADFMIIHIYTLIATTKGALSILYNSYTITLVNVAPYLKKLSMVAANKLLSLFSSFSNPAFLLAETNNHKLLYNILEVFNYIIQYQYTGNYHLIYGIIRLEKKFEKLLNFTLSSGISEIRKIQETRGNIGIGIDRDESIGSIPNSPRPSLSPRRLSGAIIVDLNESSIDEQVQERERERERQRQNDARIAEREARDFDRAKTLSLRIMTGDDENISDSVDENDGLLPITPQELSEKARGKLPEGSSQQQNNFENFHHGYRGRNGFTPTEDWVSSWHTNLPLESLIIIINELAPKIHSIRTKSPETILQVLKNVNFEEILPDSLITIRKRNFIWTEAMLVWKTSMLWGRIYIQSNQLITGGGGLGSGLFHLTNVKLFHLQKGTSRGFINGGPAAGLVPKEARDAVSGVVNQAVGLVGYVSHLGRSTNNNNNNGNTQRQSMDQRGSTMV